MLATLSLILFLNQPSFQPRAIGDRWVYQVENRSSTKSHPQIEKWTEEITTTAIEQTAEGILILRSVKSTAHTHAIRESNILIRGNCTYYLNDSASTGFGYGWDAAHHELTATFRAALASHEALPDLCLPIKISATWGDPKKGRDLWTVVGRGPQQADDPPSIKPDSWCVEAHLTSGDDNYVWFQEGIGIVAKRTWHNGTYNDYRDRLLSFKAAE